MIQFPLSDGAVFAIIEPGNIRKLKEGKPLPIGDCLVAFTPDIEAFIKLLNIDVELPEKTGKRVEKRIHLTPEQIDEALKACQNLPEVER